MFLRLGSGTNESTMSRFSTRINSLHILGNFNGSWLFEDASTTSAVEKPIYLARVSSLTTGPPLQIKKVGWIQQQFVTLARLGDRDMPGHCLGTRSQIESDCWKTETEIGTPARVEAETWKFARQRSSSRALGTRGLYVLWNCYAANSHAATPAAAIHATSVATRAPRRGGTGPRVGMST